MPDLVWCEGPAGGEQGADPGAHGEDQGAAERGQQAHHAEAALREDAGEVHPHQQGGPS